MTNEVVEKTEKAQEQLENVETTNASKVEPTQNDSLQVLLGKTLRENKKLQKEIAELKTTFAIKEKADNIKQDFIKFGGKDIAFNDWLNKHKQEVLEVKDKEVLQEIIKNTKHIYQDISLSEFLKENDLVCVKRKIIDLNSFNDNEKDIKTYESDLYLNTIYKKRK